MYQWKLLNHVSRDHNMTLKPAHLSYKCTVCTATFGMYKQFENHVYSAHSTVAKKAMDGKSKGSTNGGAGGSSGSKAGNSSSDSLLKPLKINDEITIIPQPAAHSRHSRGGGGGSSSGGSGSTSNMDSHVIGELLQNQYTFVRTNVDCSHFYSQRSYKIRPRSCAVENPMQIPTTTSYEH